MKTLPQAGAFGQRSGRSIIAALGSAAIALGSPGTLSAADAREQFREDLLAQAAKALRERRPIDAIDAWRAAFDIKPDYWLACSIGKAELEHGSPRKAAEYLALCSRLAPSDLPEPRRRKVEQLAEELNAARAQVGSLAILVSESGADIAIDERPVGKSPLPEVFVDPGAHRISVELEGHKREDILVTVGKGETRALPLTLAKSPVTAVKPPPDARPPKAPLPAPPAPERSAPVIIGGVSAILAGAAFGAGFWFAAGHAEDDANKLRPDLHKRMAVDCTPTTVDAACQEFQASTQASETFARFAVGGFIGAGVAAAATLVYIVYPRSPIKPSVGEGGTVTVATW